MLVIFRLLPMQILATAHDFEVKIKVFVKTDVHTADSGDNGDISALPAAPYVVDENVRGIRELALLAGFKGIEGLALRSPERMHGLLIYTLLFPLVARKIPRFK